MVTIWSSRTEETPCDLDLNMCLFTHICVHIYLYIGIFYRHELDLHELRRHLVILILRALLPLRAVLGEYIYIYI